MKTLRSYLAGVGSTARFASAIAGWQPGMDRESIAASLPAAVLDRPCRVEAGVAGTEVVYLATTAPALIRMG